MTFEQEVAIIKGVFVAIAVVIALLIFFLLNGCETGIGREHSGYESYQGLCVNCYRHIGKKELKIDTKPDEEIKKKILKKN